MALTSFVRKVILHIEILPVMIFPVTWSWSTMKKNTVRTAAFGTFLGLALALGLGLGTTVLSAAVIAPAAEQTKICDKAEVCPLEDKAVCQKAASPKTTQTPASALCPYSGAKI